MIIEEKRQSKIQDILHACAEQSSLIHRIIIEVEPSFERSRLKALLKSDKWPKAVNPNLIIDNSSYKDKLERGEALLDTFFVENNLTNKKFLDFGCGEGYAAKAASQRAELSVGYDIDDTGWYVFDETNTFKLTNDWQSVINNGPYDVVFIYDVLDHLVDQDPIDILKDVHSILTPNGRVHVRCHPWCSRSGNHIYRELNKAFVHMFFTEEELREMGYNPLPLKKILHPLVTYEDWFQKSGFKKIVDEKPIRQEVEDFFSKEPLLCSIIKNQWKESFEERLSSGKVFPSFQMELNFVDYFLQKTNHSSGKTS